MFAININGGIQMATLKEEAKAYIPKQTKNIADLSEVDVNVALLDGEGTDAEGKEFKYKSIDLIKLIKN